MSHYIKDRGNYLLDYSHVALIKGVIIGSTGEKSHATFVFENIIEPRIVGYDTAEALASDIKCICGDKRCKAGICINSKFNTLQFNDNDGQAHLMELSKEAAQEMINKLNEIITKP